MVGFIRFDEKNGKNACYQGFFSLWGKKEHPTGLYQILSDVMAEKEGFEPSLRLSHTTPLAGEPLRPLGYFSMSSDVRLSG